MRAPKGKRILTVLRISGETEASRIGTAMKCDRP